MDLPRRRFLAKAGFTFASILAANTLISAAHAVEIDGISAIEQFIVDRGNFSISGIELRNRAALEKIYQARNYAPLWTTTDHPTYTSVVVAQRLANASLLGLEPSKYYGRLLNQIATESYQSNLLEFEILMTDSIISYFDDLAHGATEPPSEEAGWLLKRARIDTGSIAQGFFNGEKSLSETIDELHPTHHRFNRLLNALHDYHAIADNGGWPKISKGASVTYGDRSPRIAELRQRLLASQDLQYNTSTDYELFDTELSEALIRFQTRHGLESDGVLGPNTLHALNVPVEERIAQLNLNLDRWRWLSRDLGYSNITVNTAGYEMDVTLHGAVAMNMNVIVGKPKHATPLFSDSMEHMVFNPSWYVPRSIARKLLKKEAKKPGYLASNNFEARDKSTNQPVAFSQLTPFDKDPEFFSAKYWLRQKPGDDNALGRLKFMFPNKYSIYLHDTNSPELFAESERAFSHGCVRLEQPEKLAELLLTSDGHSYSDIQHYQQLDTTKKVNLRNQLPVHLTYQTAWISDEGVLNFREDIYKHDRHALAQLDNNHT
ncbi:MAG: L,D-transpeptidase family protein, partial [Pseudomonadota bacterium]